MTDDNYIKSAETGELHLQGFNKFTHYSVVFYLLTPVIILLLVCLYYYIIGGENILRPDMYVFLPICITLSLMAYVLQKKRLKFKVIESGLYKYEIKEIFKATAKELNWSDLKFAANVFTAKSKTGFTPFHWGEKVTVLLYQDKIMVNSICNTDAKPAVTSLGRNRRNIDTLIKNILLFVPKTPV